MTEQEAKEIIRNNADEIIDHIKALMTAVAALEARGESTTMSEVWKWANEKEAVDAGDTR